MATIKSIKNLESYTKKAISLATQGRWEEAVNVNQFILERCSDDVDAYNRLGKSLMNLGKYTEAEEAYSHSLKLSPYNNIATKNLDRLSHLVKLPTIPQHHQKVSLDIFITEAGKTELVALHSLAPKEVLAKIAPGDEVTLHIEGQKLLVRDEQDDYLGEVESKYELRLIKLIRGGNKYIAAISNLEENNLKIIIREIYQHPSQVGILSFPQKGKDSYRSYTKESLFGRRPEVNEEQPGEGDELDEEYGEGFFITDLYRFPLVDNDQNKL